MKLQVTIHEAQTIIRDRLISTGRLPGDVEISIDTVNQNYPLRELQGKHYVFSFTYDVPDDQL